MPRRTIRLSADADERLQAMAKVRGAMRTCDGHSGAWDSGRHARHPWTVRTMAEVAYRAVTDSGPRNMIESCLAEKDRLRPWLGDILKGPHNGFRKSKIRTSFWPDTKVGENVPGGTVRLCLDE